MTQVVAVLDSSFNRLFEGASLIKANVARTSKAMEHPLENGARFDDANYEEIVFITSNIPDGNGYYPGVVQKFDVTTKSWNTAFDCKVVDANK